MPNNVAYLTHFKGDIALKETTSIKSLEKILRVLEATKELSDVVSLDMDTKMLYVSGNLDNSTELVERFFAKVAKVIVDGGRIQVKGDDVADRYDLVFQDQQLYLQPYDLVPDTLTLYQINQ